MGSRGNDKQMSLWSLSRSMMMVEQIIGVTRWVACREAESCSLVKMGQRLLGFARTKSLFPTLQ